MPPTAKKAKLMLKEGTANGKALSQKQKRFFGFLAGGGKPSIAGALRK